VWLIVLTGRPQVLHLDPRSLTQTDALSLPNGFPVAMAATRHDLWVVDDSPGVASRIDRSTVQVTGTTPLGQHPTSMIAHAGFVWVGVGVR